MTIDEIFGELEYLNGGFPAAALENAVREKESITPRLLQIIEESRENIQAICDQENYMLHLYAMYLLAYFGEKKACQPILKFFSIPGDITLEVTGDLVTEDLPRILASVYDGDSVSLKWLVEDREADEFVRAGALRTLCILWSEGIIQRQELLDYFHALYTEKLVGDESYVWTALVMLSSDVAAVELEEHILKAFDGDTLETLFYDREDIIYFLGRPEDVVLEEFKKQRQNQLIGDPFSEMGWWICFHPEKEGPQFMFRQSDFIQGIGFPTEKEVPPVQDSKPDPIPTKSVPRSEKIGRNEPCPCGSGKKYKKCCL